MTRFLNKYVRKFHRWLAPLFVALIITLLLTQNTPVGFTAQRAQQILMLIMAITGLYLIVWSGQSAILKNFDSAAGHDYDIMPNSCSACHAFARLSGDGD